LQFNWEENTLFEKINCAETQKAPDRPTRIRSAPYLFTDYQIYTDDVVIEEGELVQHLALMVDLEPIMFEKAITRTTWKTDMEEELKSIVKNETWEMIDLPQHKTLIDVKYVFKVKVKPNGSLPKHKAQLVAKGFMQKNGKVRNNNVDCSFGQLETLEGVAIRCQINLP